MKTKLTTDHLSQRPQNSIPMIKTLAFSIRPKIQINNSKKNFCSFCGIPNHHETPCIIIERRIADMHKQSEGIGKEGDSLPFIPRTSQTGSQPTSNAEFKLLPNFLVPKKDSSSQM
ncbi:unnamed protein product [Orchesella dallaii]|uniref:Uncharacterized protein n=1 Tax=Orchesella dallaii TaxID=48710 RepID=A0ABP1RUN7_9HEXA